MRRQVREVNPKGRPDPKYLLSFFLFLFFSLFPHFISHIDGHIRLSNTHIIVDVQGCHLDSIYLYFVPKNENFRHTTSRTSVPALPAGLGARLKDEPGLRV
jgi:hypothetical protein